MNLNENQQRAVSSRAKTIVAIAGPGSGKTRVLTERIKSLIAEGVDPGGIVAITFTNAAAKEIKLRIGEASLQHCGTLHSYMLTLLRRFGPSVLGFPERLAVIDDETRQEVIEDVCASMGIKPTKKVLSDALECVPMLNPGRTLKGAELVSAAYHVRLLQNGLLDYDSILSYGLHLLQTCKLFNLATHLLVDEYQDSGDIDDAIYRAMPISNLFVVGDPDQAIYSFRGGNPAHLVRLSKHATTLTIIMGENYRSDSAICEAADRLIAHNSGRIDKRTISQSGPAGEVNIKHCPNEGDEAREIVDSIWRTRTKTNEIAVLCRTHAHALFFAEMLETHGLSVKRRKALDIPMDWNECRAAVAWMANPENDMLAFRVISRQKSILDAVAIRAGAARALQSINQFATHLERVEVSEVRALLGRLGFTDQSLARVGEIIADLNDSSMAGLTLAMAEVMDTEDEGEGITVGTIHAAKGREWDDVYLPGWQQEIMPRLNASPEEIEESRRLAFVGVTRARHRLWVSEASMRKPYALAKQLAPFTPSQFIAELSM